MDSAIGIFDSGLGGLTVVKEIQSLLPQENLVYLGDTARVPYGNRSPKTIARYALEDANFLYQCKVKMLVVACNSAASSGMQVLRTHFTLPIIEVIEPGAKAALQMTKNKKIGIIGTSATINSRAYQKAIQQLDSEVEVHQTACPLFVPLVEEGWEKHSVTYQIAEEYLKPLKKAGIDTLILGCTHYPLLKDVLEKVMGEGINLVDSGQAVALAIKEVLSNQKRLNSGSNAKGVSRYYVTDIPQKFVEIGERFLGQKIQPVEQVKLAALQPFREE